MCRMLDVSKSGIEMIYGETALEQTKTKNNVRMNIIQLLRINGPRARENVRLYGIVVRVHLAVELSECPNKKE